MFRGIRVLENRPIPILTLIPGVNELETMALNFVTNNLGDNTVLGRGIHAYDQDKDGKASCIFRGLITDKGLTIEEKPLLSVWERPVTERGERVREYEDPTVLYPDINPIECLQPGCFMTEAYWSTVVDGWTDANILYHGLETGMTKTYRRPEDILPEVAAFFTQLNLVKEPQIAKFACGGLDLLFEVGANGKSHILRAATYWEDGLEDIRPFLTPELVSGNQHWFAEHVSTAANPVKLPDGSHLLIFNGRVNNTWRPGWCQLAADGTLVKIGEPFLDPPEGVGPHGQKIAFGSDFRYDPTSNRGRFLYHAHDKYPCEAILELVFE